MTHSVDDLAGLVNHGHCLAKRHDVCMLNIATRDRRLLIAE